MRLLSSLIFLLCIFTSINSNAVEVITGNAVGDIVIGQPPPTLDAVRVISRDWLSDENGMRYELLRMKIQGRQVDAEIIDGLVWRISIETTGLPASDGVAVGANAARVLRKNSHITPEIGPGPSLFLIPENRCGISYMTDFEFKKGFPEKLSRQSALSMLKNSRITKILVVGCGKENRCNSCCQKWYEKSFRTRLEPKFRNVLCQDLTPFYDLFTHLDDLYFFNFPLRKNISIRIFIHRFTSTIS